MLRHHGHEVDVVGNGRLAVNAVQAKTYTLCLMDLQMPGGASLPCSVFLPFLYQDGPLPFEPVFGK